LTLLALLAACSGGGTTPDAPSPTPTAPTPTGAAAPAPGAAAGTPLRIGWQTTWATQGQLVAVLQHTDILETAGFAPLGRLVVEGWSSLLLEATAA